MNIYRPGMNPYMVGMPWPGSYPGMGHPHQPYGHYHGFCPSCCHPAPLCICGVPGCRKEAKELVVRPGDGLTVEYLRGLQSKVLIAGWGWVDVVREWAELAGQVGAAEEEEAARADAFANLRKSMGAIRFPAAARVSLQRLVGIGDALLGGGCCVHLSIEYTATTDASAVAVAVVDAENTVLTWARGKLKVGYSIKEGIISSSPGASLLVVVVAALARVRWCEVFSC